MKKTDYKKELKEFYSASKKMVSFINVPEMKFITIEGIGYPEENESFQEAIGTLYSIAYTLKFMLKLNEELQTAEYNDYVVPPLESLWWTKTGEFTDQNHDEWQWKMMIMTPVFVDEALINKARTEVEKKGKTNKLNEIKFELFKEGKAVQMMHVGPYNTVSTSINTILAEIKEMGYKAGGMHHEIYLSDPRRAKPETLKTLIRRPYE